MTVSFQRFAILLAVAGLVVVLFLYVWSHWEVTIDYVDANSAARKTDIFMRGTLIGSEVSLCPYVKYSEDTARWKVVSKRTPLQTTWWESETSRGAAMLTNFARILGKLDTSVEQKEIAIGGALLLYRSGQIDELSEYTQKFSLREE
jgi:hypothetical protein